ncbi:phosphatidylserine decarboxylase family protein [Rhizoctonia solani]|uniref:Phosphatidylserine decarboxylase family protein n=1 Tax=Rhizoctonia solani TaxID=456999 RepID=A0A8H8SV66_9AGAM|nr:phosphatidylserine decarboxylase family protein [Rhizoctonia solani]QRW19661.1 phosphatidylserine decarboxylase family protein [Rhizoctonia solani]
MPGISQIAGKVRSALHRSDSTSSSSSDDVAPSPPSSPGPKQEGRGLHGKLAHSLQIIVQNSEKSESPGSNTRNYVMDRKTKEKKFEDMPIYVRIGMHLLFNQSYLSQTLLGEKRVDKLLKDQSFKQGQIYDREDPAIVQPHIQSFVETYEIDTSQLLQPDLNAYKTFNEFFARRLKPDARPIDAPHDPTIITSVADCRLTVWNNVTTATKVWVKGKHFSVPELLGDAKLAEEKFGANPSLAIFRLAPADYHRFHSPCTGTFSAPTSQGSKYYTNPQAVNTELDVFTANRRDIRVIESNIPSASALTTPVGFVAIGALLVGSIGWTDRSEGYRAEKGDDIGWFQYGGSTVIIVFPSDHIKWDDDLADASEQGIEVQAPGSALNRFAKRDPQLYPLAAIMLAITATGGYFLAQKSQTHDAAKSFGTITPAWEAHKPGDNVSEWKHRFKTRRGVEGDLGTILSQGEGSDRATVNTTTTTPSPTPIVDPSKPVYNRLADRAHDLL